MDAAWEAGITTFDTADAYGGGRSESFIGSWLRTKGADVRDADRPDDEDVQPDERRRRSRPLAGADPAPARRQPGAPRCRVGPALPRARHGSGRAGGGDDRRVRRSRRARGRSGPTAAATSMSPGSRRRCAQGRPDWAQNAYSLLDREAEEGVLEVCTREGLGFTPFSPLAGGWLTGKYRRGEEPPAGSRMTLRPEPYLHLRTDRVFDALEAFEAQAAERGTTPATLAFAWLLGSPARDGGRRRPAAAGAAPSRARCARARALAAGARPADRALRMTVLVLVGARRPRAAADGRVHRGDGRGPALARARRAAPAAPVRDAPAGRRHA